MIENQILEIVPHVCNDLFQNSYNFFCKYSLYDPEK